MNRPWLKFLFLVLILKKDQSKVNMPEEKVRSLHVPLQKQQTTHGGSVLGPQSSDDEDDDSSYENECKDGKEKKTDASVCGVCSQQYD